ncbi:hypothetical protein L1F30_05245 [Simiduia sp. 21SJ11W-1]|uniref:hypothetical protein n=1 Tax=Simiduia sp. 21SJ11W-1 TaxID=2909669 RepID=UPI00209E185C|nr:hypothetical protein [Simiduia sp. 21SJ11W-1]UTA48952.1 hypothetical protein L1F30_05245 [Simiduia sp. 21SJ11W-1]
MFMRSLFIAALFTCGANLALADNTDRQVAKPCPTPADSKVVSPECNQAKGLLLPAIQKAQATPAPRATPMRAAPQSAKRVLKARDFDRLLMQHHRSGRPIPGAKPATPSGANQVAAPQSMPKYEIADCAGGVCCSYNGENSTCNLFMYLCESQGGQATGDQNEAVCSF